MCIRDSLWALGRTTWHSSCRLQKPDTKKTLRRESYPAAAFVFAVVPNRAERYEYRELQCGYMDGLRSLSTFCYFKFNLSALFKSLVAFHIETGEMNENVLEMCIRDSIEAD